MAMIRELNSNEHEREFDVVWSKKDCEQPPSIIETNTLRSYRDERKPPNYTNKQLIQLEESYTVNPYLSQRALMNLGKKLCINEDNVRLWYRKRRSRDNSESNYFINSTCNDDCEVCMNLRSSLAILN